MKKLTYILVVACLFQAMLSKRFAQSAEENTGSSAGTLEWHTEMEAAVAEAKRTGKPILMEINGRPWCPPCNTQGEKIIGHADFKAWAVENVILLDVRVGKGYDKKKGNPIWWEQLKKHKLPGIPAAVLLDPHGETMGTIFPKDDVGQWLGAARNITTAHALKGSRNGKSGEAIEVLPFRLTKWNNISVPATLNGNIGLNLMFHTAVDAVSLTQETTAHFPEIAFDQEGTMHSWGGQSKSRFGGGHTLQLAGLEPRKVTIFEDLHSGHDTNGKFGPQQLGSPLFSVDFDRSEIRVLSQLPGDLTKWSKHPFATEEGMMFVTASVSDGNNSAEHKFMIHSGYSGFALLDDVFVAENSFLGKLEIIERSELTDSAGHRLSTRTVKLPRFTIGDTELSQRAFSETPISFFSGAIDRQRFSLLGGDFLKRFNLIVDCQNQTVYMRPNRNFDVEYYRRKTE